MMRTGKHLIASRILRAVLALTFAISACSICSPRPCAWADDSGEDAHLMWVLDHVDVEGPLVFEVPYGEDEVTKNDGRYVSGYALNLDYGNRSYTATGKLHLSTFNSDGKNQGNHGYSMRKEFSWNYPETIPLGKEGQATVSVQARSTKTIDDGEIEWGAGDLGVDLYFRLNEHPLNNKWDMEFDNGSENYSFKLSDQSASNSVKPSEIGLYMDAEELEGLTWGDVGEYELERIPSADAELRITVTDYVSITDYEGYEVELPSVFYETAHYRLNYPGNTVSGTSPGQNTVNPGQSNVTVDTEASKDPGESGGWVIPAAIIGGAAVIGGAVALSRRGRKGGDDGPGDDEPDDDPDEPSTFRMALYKEFGDTLHVGGGPQTVGALIEEVKPDGQVYVRDDLTARISFGASKNLSAQDIGMQNHYRCVNIEALNADSPEAIVSITFAGEGGTFTNNVKFKVGKTELFFGEVALTFIAGYKQTLAIPFCFAGMRLPQGVEPEFECTIWTGNVNGQGSDYFTDIKVVRDREHPEAVWNVRLTETGAAPKLEPGELERFTCEVVAKWKTDAGEQKLSGIFDLYRFVEGIRLHVV